MRRSIAIAMTLPVVMLILAGAVALGARTSPSADLSGFPAASDHPGNVGPQRPLSKEFVDDQLGLKPETNPRPASPVGSEAIRPTDPRGDDFLDPGEVPYVPPSPRSGRRFFEVDTANATFQPGEPSPCAPMIGTVWYRLDTRFDLGRYEIIPDPGTVVSVYESVGFRRTFEDLRRVACGSVAFSFGTLINEFFLQIGVSRNGPAQFLIRSIPPMIVGPGDNDRRDQAVEVSLPAQVRGTFTGSSPDVNDPNDCRDNPNAQTIWYKFVASEARDISIEEESHRLRILLGVYTLDQDQLQQVACFTNDQAVAFRPEGGRLYYLLVAPATGTNPPDFVTVGLVHTPSAANDAFGAASPIGELEYSAGQFGGGATTEPEEPIRCQVLVEGIAVTKPLVESVWYSYRPAHDARASLEVPVELPVALRVLTGNSLDDLRAVPIPDPNAEGGSWTGCISRDYGIARVTFRARTTYYLQLGFWGDVGDSSYRLPPSRLEFIMRSLARPGNDDVASATAITSLPFHDEANSAGATREPGEPEPCDGPSTAPTVWYRYSASHDGALTIDTADGDQCCGARVAVYEGEPTGGVLVDCDSPDEYAAIYSMVVMRALRGRTYFIQVTGGDAINVRPAVPPRNDDIGRPAHLDPAGETMITSNRDASTDRSDPAAGKDLEDHPLGHAASDCPTPVATLWYRFTPTVTSVLTVQAAMVAVNPSSAIAVVLEEKSLIPVACADGDSVPGLEGGAKFLARAGTSYLIQVGGGFPQGIRRGTVYLFLAPFEPHLPVGQPVRPAARTSTSSIQPSTRFSPDANPRVATPISRNRKPSLGEDPTR